MAVRSSTLIPPDATVWADRIRQVADDVQAWAAEQGWATHRSDKLVSERRVGEHTFPFVRVRTPYGELHVDPIGVDIVNADARINLEAWPTLNQVRLVGRDDRWVVVTDSNVTLREPWDRDTFLRLAHDLLAAP